jgi:acyl-homoserine-lactone acylase
MSRLRLLGLASAAAALTASAVLAPAYATGKAPGTSYAVNTGGYHVTVTRTAGGIPHIVGDGWGSIGYGYGMTFASDNLCTMAADYATVRGERSMYFGQSGTYYQGGNGITTTNLDSDVFWQGVRKAGTVRRLAAATTGPNALLPGLKADAQGYVDGWNAYLASIGGAQGVKDPACHGKAWVRPIDLDTFYLRLYQLIELASRDVVITGIAQATPPTAGVIPNLAAAPVLTPAQLTTLKTRLKPEGGLGSNAVAVGAAGTRDHKHGLLLGNPHFPWLGTERFYQAQLVIPGKVDVEGGSLFGVPVVLIGHTPTMAWSHTVSTAYRFTPYQLTLVPGQPTEYLRDGTPIPMTSRTVTVPLGGGKSVSRTLYSTRYGDVFTDLEGVPLPWTAATAFAIADANIDNFRAFNHFFATNTATSVADELRVLKTYEGIPWVNTIAADSTGHALYADIGTVPHVTDAQAQQCDTLLGAATFQLLRLPVLDGSRSACDWGSDKDSVRSGIFGGKEMPSLQRADYVTNSNDSFWLSNPKQPLTGFPQIIGDMGTARSLRTRIGLVMTQARVDGTDGLGPAGFTRQDMQNMVFNDRQYGAELDKAAAVSMCQSFPGGMAPTSSGAPVAVGSACDVLAKWNGREDVSARGAVLWRQFWERALAVQNGPWTTPFSASDPVHTPSGLNSSDPQVQMAFGDAVAAMQSAGLALDVPLGTVQYVKDAGGARIPLHGGPGDPDGDFDAIYSDVMTGRGQDPSLGSSYVQVVTWHSGSACPDSRTILTYSEAQDPTSPHYRDQTRLWSNKQWLDDGYCSVGTPGQLGL